jgi:hypothetical protein
MTKEYEVKLVVTETHYLQIEADSEAEAMDIAESSGVQSCDAHFNDVEVMDVIKI